MYHLSTNVPPETVKKMREIADYLKLNPKRNAGRVIEKAVDVLHAQIKQEQVAALVAASEK